MARKLIVYCEICGGDTLACTTDFIVFHHLSFCSPDCRDEYRGADEARRQSKEEASSRARTSKAA
jgi:hypothetical protein